MTDPAPRSPRSVVVVGGGLAAHRTVTALREEGFTGSVTLLGAEGVAPYDRPPLSKHLLDRPEPVWLAEDLGVDALALVDDVRLAEPARALEVRPDDVVVTTDAGPVVADAVVLASGAHAVRPPGWEHAHVLHTAQDAARLRAALRPGVRLVVVGAGWVGAEVAGVAAGVHVTVVEAAPAPLAAALGSDVGALTVPWYAAAGIRLVTGVGVAEVRGDGVRLTDGRHLDADVVLAAVGARPATAWLDGALPLDPDGAVRVDATWAPAGGPRHVRAVGDVARRRSPRHGLVPGGHWDGALTGPPVAVRDLLRPGSLGGAAAGATVGVPSGSTAGVRPGSAAGTTGGDPELHARPVDAVGPADDPAPYVFSTQLGHDLTLYGHRGETDDAVLRGDPGAGGWSALWFAHGTDELTAVLTVDRPRDVAAARRLFSGARLPHVDRDAAADPGRPLPRP
ncbi:NAD(P)/FAD-dependent oxidoreductase [Cellulomonas cellasea]|uniref:Oxidoreductase n=3 Tax=Cellulomonas cellasea TaxID=43670 RepID=A0A4Y3KSL2_9CELL|nr:FAD-dependent oxidoreductase [Cellulomonas cellasea]GEA86185.1 oxidoreductase [Cellulomonas cellasea]